MGISTEKLESSPDSLSQSKSWKVYCLHCKEFLLEWFGAMAKGFRTCPLCGALNRYDTANPSDQTVELPPHHTCSACAGTPDIAAAPPSHTVQDESTENLHK